MVLLLCEGEKRKERGRMNRRLKQFADNYLADPKRSAKDAALKAGYSPKTAQYASKWLNPGDPKKPNDKFKQEVFDYIQAQLDRIHDEKTADAKEVMEYLTKVMRGESTEQTLIMCGDGCQEIESIDVSAKDRIKAAELIGKSYGMFKDNANIEIQPVTIVGDIKE